MTENDLIFFCHFKNVSVYDWKKNISQIIYYFLESQNQHWYIEEQMTIKT